ncbi:MAG: sugar transferase [Terracidiphilus sp.]
MSTFGMEGLRILSEPAPCVARPNTERRSAIRNRLASALTTIEIVADWLTVVLAVHGVYWAYHALSLGRGALYPSFALAYISVAMATLVVLLLDRNGAYHPCNSMLRIKETERSLRVSFEAFLFVLLGTFFVHAPFSRWVFLLVMLSVPLLQAVEKQILFVGVRGLRACGIGTQNVAIYGAGSSGRRVYSALVRSPKLGLTPVLLVDDDPNLEGRIIHEDAYRRAHSLKVVAGPISQKLLERHACDWLIIAIPGLNREKFTAARQTADAARIQLAFAPREATFPSTNMQHADLDGILLNVVGPAECSWWYEGLKRFFDVAGGLLFSLLCFPLALVIAILVRADSPGPVLFRQQRVGKHGELFGLLKFRSMCSEAPAYALSPIAASDPRITRIGRILRRTSLDELPQLINVLKGEMSLVGPRPEMPFIARDYNDAQRRRLEVMPGITGLWQLSADRAFLIHQNIQYDMYYIENRSFFMDLAILLHTPMCQLRGI